MKKTPLVFEYDYDNEIITRKVKAGSEWVFEGEAVPTIKFDGTATLFKDGKLWKRYDRKLSKKGLRLVSKGHEPTLDLFKEAPEGFVPCESEPDAKTGHWPGWVPVSENEPNDKWHVEALANLKEELKEGKTYELVGPAFAKNVYNLEIHELWEHASEIAVLEEVSFDSILAYFKAHNIEGFVFHHPDGRVAKIRRKDFSNVKERDFHWWEMKDEHFSNV